MYFKDLVGGNSLVLSNVRVLVVVLGGLPLSIFKK